MAVTRIPATVVTGFLGSGKTTLIRNIIMQANGRRLALIVNEFGDIGMDGAMLEECGADSCGAEDIIELANGCIC
ncbi:MAG TPA: cobalamin biosynthesis protein CobW, partial [Alphaproteobacteria bacterium]|nr:cobalamin biosynthesis protein CobW [Alphaproteobacteria bacterium]